MIELSQVRCFVAVAEELHFGRAAARLNMTQPPLTRQIQLLEYSLDAKLFDRTNRRVSLTIPGRTFLPEATRLLRLAESAAASVRRSATGETGTIAVGFTATSGYDFLPRALRRLQSAMPQVNVKLREAVTSAQIEALSAGELDLALVRPTAVSAPFSSKILLREPLLLAVPRQHPLARMQSVTADDLRNEKIIGYDPHEAKYFSDLVLRLLALEDIPQNIVQQVSQIHSVLALVRAGLGVGIVPACARHLRFDGVEFVNLTTTHRASAELMLVWRTDSPNVAATLAQGVLVTMDHSA